MFDLIREVNCLKQYVNSLIQNSPDEEYIRICRVCLNMGIILLDGSGDDAFQNVLGIEYLLAAFYGYHILSTEYPFITEYRMQCDEISQILLTTKTIKTL